MSQPEVHVGDVMPEPCLICERRTDAGSVVHVHTAELQRNVTICIECQMNILETFLDYTRRVYTLSREMREGRDD